MGYKAWMLAIAVAGLAAVPAQAATTEYPSGGSRFVGDQEGWSGSGTVCDGTNGSVCSTSTVWEPGSGNPPGSITMRMSATLNLLGTFNGTGLWTSPAFTVPAGQAVTGATFAYDRQLSGGGLLSLAPESHVRVELIDEAGGAPVELLEEDLTTADSSFATRGAGSPAGAVLAGHSYRLRITTNTSTSAVSFGLTGQDNTRFDNVVLAVDQSAGGGSPQGGGSTPVVSEGVTVVRTLRSENEVLTLFRRFEEGALVGHGPGGSLVPLHLCTIVGTKRADRIVGTRGNDVICGLGGHDVIVGGGGIDLIDGANGNDGLSGGTGRDMLIGLRGRDRLRGGAGNDRVGGGAGFDALFGDSGRDVLSARDRRRDRVNGGAGRDTAKVDRLARRARRTKAALRRTDRVRRVERRR